MSSPQHTSTVPFTSKTCPHLQTFRGLEGRALVQAGGACRLCVTPKYKSCTTTPFPGNQENLSNFEGEACYCRNILEFVHMFIYMKMFQNKLFRVQYFILNNSRTTVEKPHFGVPNDSSMTTKDVGHYHIHLLQYLPSLSPEQKSPVFPQRTLVRLATQKYWDCALKMHWVIS